MNGTNCEIYGFIIFCLIIVLLAFYSSSKNCGVIKTYKEHFNEQNNNIKSFISKYEITSWVINLDKNNKRWKAVEKSYLESDMKHIPLKRFSAVVGNDLNPKVYLTKQALKDLEVMEKTNYRSRHYQLSRGGIGCFLSHYELYKKLSQTINDMFFIFEDDILFEKNNLKTIVKTINNAPKDWDIILLGFSRLHGYKENKDFIKPLGFWGTWAYVINKKGAINFLKNCDIHNMDAQIDAYLSYLAQRGKINIYAVSDRIITTTDEGSDIQFYGVKTENNEDPFSYNGLVV